MDLDRKPFWDSQQVKRTRKYRTPHIFDFLSFLIWFELSLQGQDVNLEPLD
jgi:hypothetical protein